MKERIILILQMKHYLLKNNEIVKNIIVSIFKEHWTVTSKTKKVFYTDYKNKTYLASDGGRK